MNTKSRILWWWINFHGEIGSFAPPLSIRPRTVKMSGNQEARISSWIAYGGASLVEHDFPLMLCPPTEQRPQSRLRNSRQQLNMKRKWRLSHVVLQLASLRIGPFEAEVRGPRPKLASFQRGETDRDERSCDLIRHAPRPVSPLCQSTREERNRFLG